MRAGSARAFISSVDQIALDLITGDRIKDGTIDTADLADLAVTDDKIAWKAVSQGKLSDYLTQLKVRAFRATSNQAIPDSTNTKVQFNDCVFDPLGAFDPVTNYRFTIVPDYDGYFLVHAQVKFGGGAAAAVYIIQILVNGAVRAVATLSQGAGEGQPTLQVTDYIPLSVVDYVEIWVWASIAANLQFGWDTSFLDIVRIF